MRETGGAGGEEFSQEGRAVYAVSERGTLVVQAPNEGHSIGYEDVDASCGGSECWLMPPHRNDVGIRKINGVGAGFTTAGQEVRAEGLVIGAGEVGGEDAAGCGHAGKGRGCLACQQGVYSRRRDAGVTIKRFRRERFGKTMDSKIIQEGRLEG